jgi:hypothetical protein
MKWRARTLGKHVDIFVTIKNGTEVKRTFKASKILNSERKFRQVINLIIEETNKGTGK